MAPLQRSVVACLAAILEIDPAEVPSPPAEHPEPWTVWRNWLAQRGLGLVPIQQPSGFDWPGPWLALLSADVVGGHIAAVAFGAPPGLAWHPLEGPETFEAVVAGYVVAPVRAARWTAPALGAPTGPGRVEAIAIAPRRRPRWRWWTRPRPWPGGGSKATGTSMAAARSPTRMHAATT